MYWYGNIYNPNVNIKKEKEKQLATLDKPSQHNSALYLMVSLLSR